MKDQTYRVYGYRWVVLGVFMFVNLTMQMLWITFAPITGPAAEFYGVTDLQIGYLAMSFMVTYLFLSFPASWVIDTYGFRKAVSIGAVLMGVFAILRGLAGANYTLVLIGSIGIAIGQPFLMNAWTKVPANWFSIDERCHSCRFGHSGQPARDCPRHAADTHLHRAVAYPNRPIDLWWGGKPGCSIVHHTLP